VLNIDCRMSNILLFSFILSAFTFVLFYNNYAYDVTSGVW